MSDALDADPFVLLLLRGRTRDQVLAGVRARRRGAPAAAGAARDPGASRESAHGDPAAGRAAEDAGVDARAAFAAFAGSARSPEIPAPPLPPARAGQPAALPIDPPAWRASLGGDLRELAADAASRAWERAVGRTADAGLGLEPDADLARRAARVFGLPEFQPLPSRSGVDARELARRALAWRHGGPAGLGLLHAEWDPVDPEAADLIKAARAVLRAKTGSPGSAVHNRVTAGRLQLRLGQDLRWYPYARSDGDWEPGGPPEADPAQAVAAL